ncbi:leucine--tRNA ligase [Enterocloster clostridioformis]|uniref:leucine--tRNA ligase n=2 Tax=Enterocloster clostridioformis TaxID=1531 RepID=UPI00080C7090|nr:leucine--tRNA ligase [Enterocloster clostridioformis]ANU45233.1 leucine--tRNA ligase [Lachnoclostridium sp. YL32]NDO32462.1 leucine--tRNA ligase [Enterocloster clostridioformis]OXE63484.1 leucine--tRNA ligase [Enterocloster clostridioformis]QQR00003.1 leucine--tRNA ligase [Enterocloster clostridioformis]
MATQYNHSAIEKKWRENWEEKPINVNDGRKEKYYCLDMFPYPSGSGLHVGHWRGYVISDVWSRYQLLKGKYVIHPMGWDAFGLPAENYAIKMGVHPAKSTEANIRNIKRQIKQIAAIYDWDMEVNTTDPDFYKWTQWIFVQMFKKGLAYEKEFPINWCPSCKTGLANEEVVNGCCERCGTTVTKKNLRQWMLKITAYAERLLNDLDKLEWPEKVKKMQTDWIGKSYGAEVDFPIDGREEKITVYTTRPDTLYGATFMVLAPEHALAKSLATDETREAVEKYIFDSSMRSNVDRMQAKEKTGVFTGSYAINPLNGAKTPIWLSDYVLADYGTGAIMCVPAHDDRDFEFARKFGLPIVQVIAKDGKEIENMTEAYTEANGIMINSGDWNGLESAVLKKEAPYMIEEKGFGHKTVNYKLRDWVFSRQRYWGEPIPIIHCPKCGCVPVPEDQLPLKLPEVDSYQPTGTGESPLAAIDEWVNTTCPVCGAPAKRETNTMPQWAGSSWYFLRYVDSHNKEELVSREKADKYLPVDMYIGGVEHAVLHLLYSRFYTKFLCDIGAIDFDEPFKKLFNQGMITGKNGIKMSKSKGNVVSPDDLVRDYGCDSLRLYELFVGPPELDAEWDDRGIEGVSRFLNRFWNLVMDNKDKDVKASKEMIKLRHKLVYDIEYRFNQFSLNTVISGFMEYNNKLIELARKEGGIDKETLKTFVILLAPFAPHIGEELWQQLGGTDSVFHAQWPECDEEAMKDDEIEVAVQINGKTRAVISISADSSKEDAIAAGREAVKEKMTGNVVKEIYVPGKIINIVCK